MTTTLYGADQFSAGGLSSVRGYHENTLGGDQGAPPFFGVMRSTIRIQ